MSVLSTRAGRLALQGADGEDGPGERDSSRALIACLDAACAMLDRLRGREPSHDTPHIGLMPTSCKAAGSDQTRPLVSSGECTSCCKDFDINGQINSLEVVGRDIQAVGSMLLSVDTVQVAMPSKSTLIKSEDDLQTCLMRVVAAAFVQCLFLFALGAAVSAFSDRELTPYLAMAVLCYGVCGGAALGRGMHKEIKSEVAEAANLYSAAFANYLVSYAAYLAYMVADAPTIR